LKATLLGVAALAAAGTTYSLLRPPALPAKYIADDAAKALFMALIPVLLKGALPPGTDAPQQAFARTQAAIATLPLNTQAEIGDLIKLLCLGPARRLLVGISEDWTQATPAQIEAFLQSWRFHRSPTLQTGYAALHDLVIGPWYGDESTWARIGYPGPIKELS
jgi:hypothetical protein